tara:strand:- start:129 stop:722 length:594 start_codon:yes stop_codon:yes gene_type:complete
MAEIGYSLAAAIGVHNFIYFNRIAIRMEWDSSIGDNMYRLNLNIQCAPDVNVAAIAILKNMIEGTFTDPEGDRTYKRMEDNIHNRTLIDYYGNEGANVEISAEYDQEYEVHDDVKFAIEQRIRNFGKWLITNGTYEGREIFEYNFHNAHQANPNDSYSYTENRNGADVTDERMISAIRSPYLEEEYNEYKKEHISGI